MKRVISGLQLKRELRKGMTVLYRMRRIRYERHRKKLMMAERHWKKKKARHMQNLTETAQNLTKTAVSLNLAERS